MAGPVAHIMCALAILNSGLLTIQDPAAFIVGNSFPDIRYLGVIKREKTHAYPIRWADIQNEPSSFRAGMLFHALIDRVREEYMVEHKIYRSLPKSRYLSQTLKIYEDMLLYDLIDSWPTIIRYFDTILPEERSFGIADKDIMRWHRIVQRYLNQSPTSEQIIYFITGFALGLEPPYNLATLCIGSAEKRVYYLIKSFQKQKRANHLIRHFYASIPAIVAAS